MNVPQRVSRAFRLDSAVNDINPVNWKTVLTGWMQFFAVVAFFVGWDADVFYKLSRNVSVDFHETAIGIVFGFLAGLSGFTLAGRINDRKTDYGYVERVNMGKAIDATAPPSRVSPQVNAGDNAQINVSPQTQEMPAPAAAAPVVAPVTVAPVPPAPLMTRPPRTFDPGA